MTTAGRADDRRRGRPPRRTAGRRRSTAARSGASRRPRPGCRSSTAATRPAPTASSRSAAARSGAGRSTRSSTRPAAWPAAGYREVTLLGQNVNSYGHDLPVEARFAGIAPERSVGRHQDRQRPAGPRRAAPGDRRRSGPSDGQPAIPRLRFVTSHPWDLSDRLISAMADCPSVCEHLHLPVQSGDDAVLRRMGRQYTIEHYLERLGPDPRGGAGDRDQHGRDRRLLRRDRGPVRGHAATARGGPATTRSSPPPTRSGRARRRPTWPTTCRPAVKRRRLNELLAVQEAIGLERNRARVGTTAEVLVESIVPPRSHDHETAPQAPRPTDGTGLVHLTGRSRAHTLVHLEGPAELVGRLVDVRIEHAGPYSLRGALA